MGIFSKRSVNELGEKKKDMPEGLWTKCPSCGESLYEQALAKNQRVCNHCGHHFTLSAAERIALIADEGSFEETDVRLDSVNALGFKDYLGKVKAYQAKTGLTEAVVTGRATIEGHPVTLAIMDFRFLGASMGSVVGEKITRAIELATREKRAVIVFSASGGARMHEGILSLMQMAKTSGALARHSEAKLPYKVENIADKTARLQAFFSGKCDAVASSVSALAADRLLAPKPDDYVLVPQRSATEPLALVSRPDTELEKTLFWGVQVMVAAEEFGLTSGNVEAKLAALKDLPVDAQRLIAPNGPQDAQRPCRRLTGFARGLYMLSKRTKYAARSAP